jgi:multiple sugar transport system permease protein
MSDGMMSGSSLPTARATEIKESGGYSAWLRRHRGTWFVLPAVIVVLLVTIFPMVYALVVSFFRWNLRLAAEGWKFVGFRNYIYALTDERFQLSLLHTMQIAIPALILEFAIGLGLALLLNRRIPGRAVFVSLLVVPVLIAPAAIGMMWRLLLGVEFGAINGFLQYVLNIPIAPDWLGNSQLARWTIVMVDVWTWTPFVMLILLAGLTNIPDELYEAAKVDGATAWPSFRYITLPMLRLPIIVVFLMRLIDMIKLFDTVYMLTEGGPGNATETITFYTYSVGIRFTQIGDGAAMSYLIVILATIIVTIYFKVVPLRAEAKSVS